MANTSTDKTTDYRLDELESDESDVSPPPQAFTAAVGDAGKRLDAALAGWLPGVSRTRVKALIEAGQVHVNGELALPKRVLQGDERVTVVVAEREPPGAYQPEAQALPIVYEDTDLLVLNKPAGWVVHPGAGNASGTLLNFLLAYHPAAITLARAGIVHRLDKETTGLMVVAKTERVQLALTEMIAARTVKREYLAIVRGLVEGPGKVDAPIGRHSRDRTRMAIAKDAQGGRAAVTHYSPLHHWDRHTLLRCKLETGRTHQIRVHMAHIRHPIEGDPVYTGRGSGRDAAAHDAIGRQALHATHLSFRHPTRERTVSLDAAPPDDFVALQEALDHA
jgi:23S rRNA pseudouridine1911/1915/1917 synthase